MKAAGFNFSVFFLNNKSKIDIYAKGEKIKKAKKHATRYIRRYTPGKKRLFLF